MVRDASITLLTIFNNNWSGGVLYPILLRYLFRTIGFGWAVRVLALVSAIFGTIAILTVSVRLDCQRKPSSLVDIRLINDRQYLLLVAGSFFVCMGAKFVECFRSFES